jgi:hypothetical protein
VDIVRLHNARTLASISAQELARGCDPDGDDNNVADIS